MEFLAGKVKCHLDLCQNRNFKKGIVKVNVWSSFAFKFLHSSILYLAVCIDFIFLFCNFIKTLSIEGGLTYSNFLSNYFSFFILIWKPHNSSFPNVCVAAISLFLSLDRSPKVLFLFRLQVDTGRCNIPIHEI